MRAEARALCMQVCVCVCTAHTCALLLFSDSRLTSPLSLSPTFLLTSHIHCTINRAHISPRLTPLLARSAAGGIFRAAPHPPLPRKFPHARGVRAPIVVPRRDRRGPPSQGIGAATVPMARFDNFVDDEVSNDVSQKDLAS